MSSFKALRMALIGLTLIGPTLVAIPAQAAPTLAEVQAKVRQLEEDATSAA